MARRVLVTLVVPFIVLLPGTGPASASASARASVTEPVFFVHGLNALGPLGYPCSWYWGAAEDAFRGWGWTGPLLTVKYYGGDTGCDVSLLNGSVWTPIEQVGKSLAWNVYTTYSSKGQAVDLVGHSMGGLIIRSALTGVANHTAGYPPYLLVDRAVSLSTPHGGAPLSLLCAYGTQCLEMVPGSSFLKGLGADPQGRGGTAWTAIGSYWDEVVPSWSSTDMGAPVRILYRWPAYLHVSILFDASSSPNATWDRSDDGGPPVTQSNEPASLHEIFDALSSGPVLPQRTVTTRACPASGRVTPPGD